MLNHLLREIINLPQINSLVKEYDGFARNKIEDFVNHYIQVSTSKIDFPFFRNKSSDLRTKNQPMIPYIKDCKAGILGWDIFKDEVYFSPNYYNIIGFKPDELPTMLKSWINLLHPDDREYVVNTLLEFLYKDRKYFYSEYRLKTKEGFWKKIISKGKLVDSGPDDSIYMISINLDITDMGLKSNHIIGQLNPS